MKNTQIPFGKMNVLNDKILSEYIFVCVYVITKLRAYLKYIVASFYRTHYKN